MIAAAFRLRPKPLYGAPCNSCGLCCIATQCPLSLAVFGDQDICPALGTNRLDPGSLICGLAAKPSRFLASMPAGGEPVLREAIGLLLGAGQGCDSVHGDADRLFGSLRRIVLDELHALVTSKRGELLSLGIARLATLAPGLRLTALSATVSRPDLLRDWIARNDAVHGETSYASAAVFEIWAAPDAVGALAAEVASASAGAVTADPTGVERIVDVPR